jgi:WD40 repeat protein
MRTIKLALTAVFVLAAGARVTRGGDEKPADPDESSGIGKRIAHCAMMVAGNVAFSKATGARADDGEFKTLEGHKDGVRCVAFSPDGDKLASGGEDGELRIWDVSTGKSERLPADPKRGRIHALKYSADGKKLLVWCARAGDELCGSVDLWDLDAEKPTQLIALRTGAIATFSSDGKLIATGGRQGLGDVDVEI